VNPNGKPLTFCILHGLAGSYVKTFSVNYYWFVGQGRALERWPRIIQLPLGAMRMDTEVLPMKLTKRQNILGTIGLVIIVSVTGTKIYFRHENIRVALEFGHLATLPENSENVNVETAGSFFSRTFWLTFESTSEEIDKWLSNSKGLTRKEWENSNGKRNPIIKVLDQKTGEWRELKPEPMRTSAQPDWFNPEELMEGELYEVSIEHEALYGKVWVDRKNNRVFIKTSHS
jgi:hypothetical protein